MKLFLSHYLGRQLTVWDGFCWFAVMFCCDLESITCWSLGDSSLNRICCVLLVSFRWLLGIYKKDIGYLRMKYAPDLSPLKTSDTEACLTTVMCSVSHITVARWALGPVSPHGSHSSFSEVTLFLRWRGHWEIIWSSVTWITSPVNLLWRVICIISQPINGRWGSAYLWFCLKDLLLESYISI